MSKKYNESVLCFPTRLLETLPKFDKITKNFYSQVYYERNGTIEYPKPQEEIDWYNICSWSIDYDQEIFNSGQCTFLDRNIAEGDERYKQIIPYVVVATTPPEGGEKVYLVYKRGKSGGESRLHDQYSIGWGGHINTGDGDRPIVAYLNAITRELEEELGLVSPEQTWVNEIAVISDDSNPVGRVHFGIVSTLELTLGEAEGLTFENSAKDVEWKSLQELQGMNLETWSDLIVNGGFLE